jgi:hypothetical protein
VGAILSGAQGAFGATDPRFFGTYCGEDTVRACGRICLTPIGPCFRRCRDVRIEDIFVRVGHKEGAGGTGYILGSGTATVDGDPLKLNVSAVVTGFGRAKGVVASNRFDNESGVAELASDGATLTVSARNQCIRVSKTRCGNAPPSVQITRPPDGSTLVVRALTLFRGDIKDEDQSFPRERLQFASDRDGPLGGAVNAQPTSLEISTDALSPGEHRITFSATDSGGLTASDTIRVSVANPIRYSAKFVCGKSAESGAARGTYFTAINVNNPTDGTVSFRKRFSVGLREQEAGPLTRFYPAQLEAGRTFRVECPEVVRTVGAGDGFLEGFVVFETPEPLNIVAVHSAAGQSGFVETLDVQAVGGIRVPVKSPDLVVEGGCDLSMRVRNIGQGDAGPSTTTVTLTGQTFNVPTPAIEAGGVASLPAPGRPPAGDFGATFGVDSENRVAESSETNNLAVINCVG